MATRDARQRRFPAHRRCLLHFDHRGFAIPGWLVIVSVSDRIQHYPSMTHSTQHSDKDESGGSSRNHEPELESKAATKGSLLVIFLTVFIDLLGFGIVLPLLPLYADIFSQDPSGFTIGMLMASFSIMQFLFAPIWGSISDRIGRRPVIIIGLLGSVVFYTAFAFAAIYHSLPGLFLTRIGAGIAGATIPTAQAYIADTTSKENRARGMALIGMAFGLGFTLGPLFAYFAVPGGEQVASDPNFVAAGDPGAGPGFVAAGLSAVALLLAIFLLPESRRPGAPSQSRTKWIDLAAWRTAISNRAMIFLLGGFFLCIFSFANFETTLSMLIKGSKSFENAPFEFSFKQVCLTFAVIGLMVAVVQGGIVRRLSKRVSEKNLAVGGAIIEVAGFGILLVCGQNCIGGMAVRCVGRHRGRIQLSSAEPLFADLSMVRSFATGQSTWCQPKCQCTGPDFRIGVGNPDAGGLHFSALHRGVAPDVAGRNHDCDCLPNRKGFY